MFSHSQIPWYVNLLEDILWFMFCRLSWLIDFLLNIQPVLSKKVILRRDLASVGYSSVLRALGSLVRLKQGLYVPVFHDGHVTWGQKVYISDRA